MNTIRSTHEVARDALANAGGNPANSLALTEWANIVREKRTTHVGVLLDRDGDIVAKTACVTAPLAAWYIQDPIMAPNTLYAAMEDLFVEHGPLVHITAEMVDSQLLR